MFTAAATASFAGSLHWGDGVYSRAELYRLGCTPAQITARLAAGRWRSYGAAISRHNGPLTFAQRTRVALTNTGPRALLTAFTTAELQGLTGWARTEIHVLAAAGASRPPTDSVPIRLHRTRHLPDGDRFDERRRHRLAPALVLGASSLASPRSAVGLLAAGVQQRLVHPAELRTAVSAAVRTRHRALLLAALDDIEMGAQALSELDFAQLCRRHGLPEPQRQAVRSDINGRRRYLDVEWRRPDGRVVVVEVDGALHMVAQRWFDDQLRQNDLVLAGALVLRYPSVVVRTEPELVVRQLRRALFG